MVLSLCCIFFDNDKQRCEGTRVSKFMICIWFNYLNRLPVDDLYSPFCSKPIQKKKKKKEWLFDKIWSTYYSYILITWQQQLQNCDASVTYISTFYISTLVINSKSKKKLNVNIGKSPVIDCLTINVYAII